MNRFVLPFPVLPDRSGKEVAEYALAHPDEYKEARRAGGPKTERAYLQTTPMGRFVVVYSETEGDLPSMLAGMTDPSREFNRRFVELVKECHGVDLTQPPPGPPPETMWDWRDVRVSERRKGFAFSAPLLPGKTEAGRAFAKEATVARRAEFEASRRGKGINAELVTLNQTPVGDVIAVYLEGDDPVEGNRQFASSISPYDRWFKDECKKLFPSEIDFDQPVPGIEEIFDSERLAVNR